MNPRFVVVLLFGAALATDGVAASAPSRAGATQDPAASLASLDRRISDIDSEKNADRAELAQLESDAPAARGRLVEHGRMYYRLTRAGLLPIGGGFAALVTYAMRVERARRVVTADLREERRIQRRAADLQREVDQLERDRGALAVQRQATAAQQSAFDDERRRQAAFERAFQTSTGAAGAADDYVAVYGAGGTGAPEIPAGGFASARGRLLFPVTSRSEVRPARREGSLGPGLEIHAPAGTPVRAVFAARVAFADRYGPYGRIVILDHGDHYYTVSGNLDAVDVKIGQDVGAGDRIGTVGDEGAGSLLYFEVRRGSRAVPPEPWLGL